MRFNWPGSLKAALEACTMITSTLTGCTLSGCTITTPTITGATLAGSVAGTNVTATGNLGYATGAGGTVTQGTDKTTAVTLNKTCGTITMHAAELAAGAEVGFTLTNSTIAATDVVVVCIKGVATVSSYQISVDGVATGSCHITLANLSVGALAEAITLNFAVIKAVAA